MTTPCDLKPHATRTQQAVWIALLLAAVSGCNAALPTMPWQKVRLDAASGLYHDAALTYRLDAGKLGQPLDVVRVQGQRVSYEQVASSPLPDESIGTLTLVYPHPSGNTGMALARFVLDSRKSEEKPVQGSGWNPFGKSDDELAEKMPSTVAGGQPVVHETWEMDIPHQEMDGMFKALNNLGFYHLNRPGPAKLTVTLDGVEQTKDWEQVAVLNQLIQRIRTQGQLVAYSRPRDANGTAGQAIASTQAYRHLLDSMGIQSAQRSMVASAFSLAPAPVPPGGYHPPPAYGYPHTTDPGAIAQQPAAPVR